MRPTEDTYRHKGLRKKLAQTVQAKGITDERVLDAILEVPRHFFLDSAFDELALISHCVRLRNSLPFANRESPVFISHFKKYWR